MGVVVGALIGVIVAVVIVLQRRRSKP